VLDRLKHRAAQLRTELYAVGLAYRDPRVPWYARVLAASVVAYAFSPIDLIPDFVPILGYLDDLIVVPLGIMLVVKLIPDTVMEECRLAAAENQVEQRHERWAVASLIVLFWLALAWYASRLLLPGAAE
jgi:uncharacterized membrane protein YkvA (DUF1232 family)